MLKGYSCLFNKFTTNNLLHIVICEILLIYPVVMCRVPSIETIGTVQYDTSSVWDPFKLDFYFFFS